MTNLAYFEVAFDHDAVDGSLRPLSSFGIALAVPTMLGKDGVSFVQSAVQLEPLERLAEHDRGRIIPGTRYLEVQDSILQNALRQEGSSFVEVSKPTKADIDKQVKAHSNDHVVAAKLVALTQQQEGTAAPKPGIVVPEGAIVTQGPEPSEPEPEPTVQAEPETTTEQEG